MGAILCVLSARACCSVEFRPARPHARPAPAPRPQSRPCSRGSSSAPVRAAPGAVQGVRTLRWLGLRGQGVASGAPGLPATMAPRAPSRDHKSAGPTAHASDQRRLFCCQRCSAAFARFQHAEWLSARSRALRRSRAACRSRRPLEARAAAVDQAAVARDRVCGRGLAPPTAHSASQRPPAVARHPRGVAASRSAVAGRV